MLVIILIKIIMSVVIVMVTIVTTTLIISINIKIRMLDIRAPGLRSLPSPGNPCAFGDDAPEGPALATESIARRAVGAGTQLRGLGRRAHAIGPGQRCSTCCEVVSQLTGFVTAVTACGWQGPVMNPVETPRKRYRNLWSHLDYGSGDASWQYLAHANRQANLAIYACMHTAWITYASFLS